MPRDPVHVDEELVAAVRARTRAEEVEVRAALASLSTREEQALRRALRSEGDLELGPFGWADVARGVEVRVAQAREVSGFYALQAERDALAAMVGTALPSQPTAPKKGASKASRPKPAAKAPRARVSSGRAQELLGLFAYHRDAPLVARALKLSLTELLRELDEHKIRRAAFRLTRGIDADLPRAAALPGAPTPAVRRRTKEEKRPKPPPPKSAVDDQAAELRGLLAELGPRRTALAARLGGQGAPLGEGALLAKFRAAGLERELSLRERDLIRALYKKHRGSEARVAAELQLSPEDLRLVIRERGLTRELDGLRTGFLRDARRARWPQQRIAQVLDHADDLRSLGLYDELFAEVSARTRVLWKGLAGKRDAVDLLARTLRLERRDALRLQRLLDLR
jgi:hypothetical protein